jgi:hypothetical protein
MDIEFVGRDAIVQTPSVAFTYQVSESPRDFTEERGIVNNIDWSERYDLIGEYRVYPYGCNNDLPDIIKQTVQENYMAPGIIKKKTQLLWGSGPVLYKEDFDEKGLPIRKYQNDKDITDWLMSWDYHTYIMKAITDFHHIEGAFTRFELTKGGRIIHLLNQIQFYIQTCTVSVQIIIRCRIYTAHLNGCAVLLRYR